jgi:beta-lactamase class A
VTSRRRWRRRSARGSSARSAVLLALAGFVVSALLVPASSGAAGKPERQRHWQPDVAAAKRYAQGRAGEVAFATIDQRGRFRGYRVRDTAPAASVFKVMLLASLLRKRAEGRLRRSDRRLLAPMIRWSDNVTATTVRDMVGVRRIRRLARVAGMRDFRYHPVWGLSETSPRDQVRFIYRLQRYVPGRHRAYDRWLLSHVVRPQRWGIGRAVPRGWRLFLKGGWGSGSGRVDHQVALIKRGRKRVALAIFTEFNPSHAYGKRTLRGVARRLLRGL